MEEIIQGLRIPVIMFLAFFIGEARYRASQRQKALMAEIKDLKDTLKKELKAKAIHKVVMAVHLMADIIKDFDFDDEERLSFYKILVGGRDTLDGKIIKQAAEDYGKENGIN